MMHQLRCCISDLLSIAVDGLQRNESYLAFLLIHFSHFRHSQYNMLTCSGSKSGNVYKVKQRNNYTITVDRRLFTDSPTCRLFCGTWLQIIHRLFSEGISKILKRKKQLGKLKCFAAMLLDMLMADTCKAANPRVSFILLGSDFLDPKNGKRKNITAVELRPQYCTVLINTY